MCFGTLSLSSAHMLRDIDFRLFGFFAVCVCRRLLDIGAERTKMRVCKTLNTMLTGNLSIGKILYLFYSKQNNVSSLFPKLYYRSMQCATYIYKQNNNQRERKVPAAKQNENSITLL